MIYPIGTLHILFYPITMLVSVSNHLLQPLVETTFLLLEFQPLIIFLFYCVGSVYLHELLNARILKQIPKYSISNFIVFHSGIHRSEDIKKIVYVCLFESLNKIFYRIFRHFFFHSLFSKFQFFLFIKIDRNL